MARLSAAGRARRLIALLGRLTPGEIRLVDDHLAMLRAKLDDLGVAGKTIIVVTADHGDEFFEQVLDIGHCGSNRFQVSFNGHFKSPSLSVAKAATVPSV